MAIPKTSHGISYQFNAARFRNAIQFVFEMEDPVDTDKQIIFHFDTVSVVTGPADGEDVPFNPAAPITRTTPAPVTVPCDVQFIQSTEVPTAFGVVIPSKLIVTLLDVDYALIEDCTYAAIGTERYLRDFEQPSFNLFEVGIHLITFVAENER